MLQFSKIQEFLKKERFLFLVLLVLEIIYFAWLMVERRIPSGHDGFQYFSLQYYFLNNMVNFGEVPQWMPFMTQGTVATWWYFVQAGIFQNVLMLTGGLLKFVNFIYIFDLGMFFDELLFLVGSWLFARRFFNSSLTVFFVCLSLMTSCVWMTQPWYNFHFYYAIPLILHFGHLFLEHGQWRYFLMAGNLFVVQMLGNLPYFFPVSSLVIFLYFLFYMGFNKTLVSKRIKQTIWSKSSLGCLVILALSMLCLYYVSTVGVDQIINYNLGRKFDSTISLKGFLSYAGNLDLYKWHELFVGISPTFDYVLYSGLLVVPLIILGIFFNFQKRNFHFIVLILVLLAMSVGGYVAVLFYYVWPMMKFYRHLALISPIIKVFLCFLAGFGFELITIDGLYKRKAMVYVSIILFFLILTIVFFADHAKYLLSHMVSFSGQLPVLFDTANEGFILARLDRSMIFALSFILIIFIYFVLDRKKLAVWGVVLLLAFYVGDTNSYRYAETSLRSLSLTDKQAKIMMFQAMPFAEFRETSISKNGLRNSLIGKLLIQGQLYWTNDSFTFQDEVGNSFRTDHWLLPLDNLMRTYWGQAIDDLSVKPKGLVYYHYLYFPLSNPAVKKIAGVTENKIQFFSDAHLINGVKTVSSYMKNPNYKGDILLLSTSKILADRKKQSDFLSSMLNFNERLNISYLVEDFSANHLQLLVNVQGRRNIWMVYSDVWHPFWRAYVNGQIQPIWKANLAYKAVQLKQGVNHVHFVFKSFTYTIIQFLFSVNALIWMVVLIWYTRRILIGQMSIC